MNFICAVFEKFNKEWDGILSISFLLKTVLEYSLIYHIVLVSGVRQSESVIRTHIATLSLDYFPV